MFINSDFNDYYDFGQKFGQDPKVIYNRKKESFGFDNKTLLNIEQNIATSIKNINSCLIRHHTKKDENGKTNEIFSRCLILCGKPYFLIENYTEYLTWCNSLEEYLNYIDEEIKTDNRFKWNLTFLKRNISEFPSNEKLEQLNRHFNSPILLFLGGMNMDKDVCLKDLGFKKDGYEVFSEIFQFLTCKDPDIVYSDDETKIKAHSFDDTSFRRDKGGPTRKRKKQ